MDVPTTKPPNVLVYTGEDFNSGDPALYRDIAKTLNSTLRPDCYTVYLLTPSQVRNDPWEENSTLLVLSCETLTADIKDKFLNYVTKGGKILNFGCNFTLPGLSFAEQNGCALVTVNDQGRETWLYPCKYTFDCPLPETVLAADTEDSPRIVLLKPGNGVFVVSSVHLELNASSLECDEQMRDVLNDFKDARMIILKGLLSTYLNLSCCEFQNDLSLTVGFLLARKNMVPALLDNSQQTSFRKLNVTFFDYSKLESLPAATEKDLPVLYNSPETQCPPCFNKQEYFSHLKTDAIGQFVIFVETIGTTMDVIQSIPDVEGTVVIAQRQIHGKGRRGNHWITPKGSIAFSAYFSLSLQSPLGQKMSIIQYFVVLSLVKAVRETPGYENLDVQVKWPNDIYCDGQTKIGGVIVNSTIQGNDVHIYTGSGLNVDNSKPTMCINEAIRIHNLKTGQNLSPFTVEQLIACSLNELEKLVMNYQQNNSEYFLSSYYKYWMHMGQKVTVHNREGLHTIVGIDQYGFLVVESENKKKIALQPDGNSFDIMKNLIILREM